MRAVRQHEHRNRRGTGAAWRADAHPVIAAPTSVQSVQRPRCETPLGELMLKPPEDLHRNEIDRPPLPDQAAIGATLSLFSLTDDLPDFCYSSRNLTAPNIVAGLVAFLGEGEESHLGRADVEPGVARMLSLASGPLPTRDLYEWVAYAGFRTRRFALQELGRSMSAVCCGDGRRCEWDRVASHGRGF